MRVRMVVTFENCALRPFSSTSSRDVAASTWYALSVRR